MSSNLVRRQCRRTRTFQPSLEALEDRCCPSASAGQSMPSPTDADPAAVEVFFNPMEIHIDKGNGWDQHTGSESNGPQPAHINPEVLQAVRPDDLEFVRDRAAGIDYDLFADDTALRFQHRRRS